MTLNLAKLGRTVTLMKYSADLVSLIFLQKNLIWNKIRFPTSNALNLAQLLVNELMRRTFQKTLPVFFFLTNLSLLNVKTSRPCNCRTRQLYKNPHQYSLL